jgi:hypothetical protein
MTRAAWMFLGSLGVSLVACGRTTDPDDGGGPHVSTTQPTLDARADTASPNDGTAEARERDASAADIGPLTP